MPSEVTDTTPRGVFARQIECIRRDDRDTQLDLYAGDCVYEFPFAVDRPRRLNGRDEIRRVMTPLWEAARRSGAKVVGCEATVHQTADPELIVAEFTLSVQVWAQVSEVVFVQVMRVGEGQITHVREYFSPQARSELLDRGPRG